MRKKKDYNYNKCKEEAKVNMPIDKNELAKITKERNEELAKSLGYSSFKEMKSSMPKSNLSGGVKSRLEQGGGIAESVGGGIKSNLQGIKRSLNPKTVAKKFYNDLFSGPDILSSFMRGRIVSKPGASESSKLTPKSPTAAIDGEQAGLTSGIANDVATIRDAVSALVNFERENKEQSAREGDNDFFKAQADKEAALEASPEQMTVEGGAAGGEEEKSGGGLLGLLGKIGKFLIGGLVSAFKFLFNPRTVLKVLGKAFILGALFVSLFKGITEGFERYKETGNIGEAITAGLGAMLDFITFGLFGEDSLKSMFSAIGDFVKPITDKIGSVFTSIKDWIVNNVGIPKITIPLPVETLNKLGLNLPTEFTLGPYYPFKDNPTSEEDEITATPEASLQEKLKEKAKEVGIDVDKISPAGLMKVADMPTSDDRSSNSPIGGLNSMLNSPEAQSVISQLPQSEALDKDVAGVQNFLQGGGVDSAIGKLSEGTAGVESAMGNAMSSITDKINAGGVTPSAVTPMGSATSGSVVNSGSTEVEDGQREEFNRMTGNIFNTPSTTNNTGSTGDNHQPAAPVINFDFTEILTRT